jgi:carboxyl-terminal processing protease
MLSGLGPLFDRDTLGYGVDRNNHRVDTVTIQNGIPVYHGKQMVNIKTICSLSRPIPMAILIGPATASSGEIIAALFSQQKNSRSFGEKTSGFLNATEGFLFMEQRGYLLLSVNWLADASRRVYKEEYVTPAVYVKSEDNYDDLLQDPTVIAALKWLTEKK